MSDFWEKQWVETEHKRVKNECIIGYLCGALKQWLTDAQLAQLLDEANAAANEVYDRVDKDRV